MNKKNIDCEEKILTNFLLDIDCLNELNPWIDNFNIFDVLKITKTEIRHSNMISWLLTPNENHGLGDLFLKNFICSIVKKGIRKYVNPLDFMTTDLSGFRVSREWEHIDILLTSESYIIAIENKIDSDEHNDQLENYRKIIEERYANQKKVYVYLTPDGIAPSDEDYWDILTYEDILESLDFAYNSKKNDIAEGARTLIQDYINLLRSKIVEDRKLVEICKKIYLKYKPALDLIYDNKGNFIADNIHDAILDQKVHVDSDKTRNTWFVFSTDAMNSILHPLPDGQQGSWSDRSTYKYWISVSDNELVGCFELGGWGLTDELKNKQQVIINYRKNNARKTDDFRFKRVFKTKKYEVDPGNGEEIKNAVKQIVEELLGNEEKIVKQFTK